MFLMPKIDGVRCPVVKPLGSFGADGAGCGIGEIVTDEGGRLIIVAIEGDDGLKLAAAMNLDKAQILADRLTGAIKRQRRKLRNVGHG